MRPRGFRADTMQEAIRLAKAELGPDALIVEVRRSERDGRVEITAVPGETNEFQLGPPAGRFDPAPESVVYAGPRVAPRRRSDRAPRPIHLEDDLSQGAADVDADGIRQFGIADPLAEQLAAACAVGTSFGRQSAVAKVLHRALTMRDLGWIGHERIVAALVGPSGVGKTTTIAKLAAVVGAGARARVALVTTDTYRVGGIAQLKTFAQILRLPFYTVYTREDLDAVLGETREADLVLIDTPGINPYDSATLREMRNLIGAGGRVTSYLTLAMPGDFDEMVTAAQRFALLSPGGLIATKLDETRRAAAVIGLAYELRLPLTYTCAGPLVPDDISLATPAGLADLLLGGLEYRYRRQLA